MKTSPPNHIAVIPDGNRRWAKAHDVSTADGHKAGYDALVKLADLAFARGVKFVTAYIFSTENWNRTKEEVGYLMRLVHWAVDSQAR